MVICIEITKVRKNVLENLKGITKVSMATFRESLNESICKNIFISLIVTIMS